MKILVLGGTYFLGIHLVNRLIERKHDITLFNRGSRVNVFPNLKLIKGDRNSDDINQLRNKNFDCVIDISGYTIHHVLNMIDIVENTIPYYIFISSTATFLDNDQYSKDKIACEDEIKRRYKNYLILRPHYICGKYDYFERFDYSKWPKVYWKNSTNEVDYDDVNRFTEKLVDLMESNKAGIYTRID